MRKLTVAAMEQCEEQARVNDCLKHRAMIKLKLQAKLNHLKARESSGFYMALER